MADSDNKYYKNKIKAGFKKFVRWCHKDDIADITAYVDSKAERRKLIDSVDKLDSVKGEK